MWPFSAAKKTARGLVRLIRAKFDMAQTTAENRKHWANADGLSALSAANPEVRRILRNRSRYEVQQNSYARGIVLTLANDVIGTGPRLQMLTNNATANGLIEAEFAAWATAVDLAGKLRTMRMARAQDGEAFCAIVANPGVNHEVKLDLQTIEADQVASPQMGNVPLNAIDNDGITFDAYGNPVAYTVLTQHPGDTQQGAIGQAREVSARWMIHWFRTDRPGQHRGLPDILPALPLFAQLRRYTLAVIGAAETAANVGVIMSTTAPAGGEAAEVDPTTEMELARNAAVFMPEGWSATQIRAEQPTTTYAMFKGEILNEIARCLNMPFNIAACNSSSYNYASGRMDHQTYYKSIRVDQAQCEAVVLDRILTAWLAEAGRVLDELPALEQTGHQWFWEGHEHVDPAKEASAQAQRLTSNTTTLAAEYACLGRDWEAELNQRAKEVALLKKLGLSAPTVLPLPPDKEEEQSENEDEEAEQK